VINIIVDFYTFKNGIGTVKDVLDIFNEYCITFESFESQIMADQVIFYNCKNVPDTLPESFMIKHNQNGKVW